MICKVHAWKEGLQVEWETIAFVREHFPSVPVTEVLYGWVDKSINRCFFIMKRMRARTLDETWSSLTHQQRLNIAKEVAGYTALVATAASSRYQTVSGCAVDNPFLMQGHDFHSPIHHWFPRTVGPFSGPELRAYWSKISSVPPPSCDDTFVLSYGDQGPTNILVSDDGNSVAAVIDWANASYVPRFWVLTIMLATGVHSLEKDTSDRKA